MVSNVYQGSITKHTGVLGQLKVWGKEMCDSEGKIVYVLSLSAGDVISKYRLISKISK